MNKVDEILKQYPYIGEDIQKAQAELNRYIMLQQEARDPLKAQVLSHEPHSTEINDQTYNAIEKIIDLYQAEIDKYVAEINELIRLKKWLDKAFTTLTEDERRILYLRYERGMSMEKIPYALKWKYGRTKVFQTMDAAKEKIKRIIC